MQVAESLGDCLRVVAGVLDVIADRFAIGADIDDDIIADRCEFSTNSPSRSLMYRLSVAAS